MRFLVHGATGAQGSPIHHALKAEGHSPVAAVRNTSGLDGAAVSVDFSSVESLATAYTGVDGVFIHLPLAAPAMQEDFARNIASALSLARPARVVFSTSGYPASPEAPLTAHGILVAALIDSGLSYAIVAPRLYLENLLLPPVLEPVRESGSLRYPLRDDYLASWSSHLDVADVVVKLLTDRTVSGNVSVGSLPALTGKDLAKGFADYLGSAVLYEGISPTQFGVAATSLFGEAGVRPVVEAYEYRQNQHGDIIPETDSAQKLLHLVPRSVEEWLRDLAV